MALAAILAVPWIQDQFGIAAFEKRLRGLEGKIGLDPLDPVQPLVSTRVLKFETPEPFPGGNRLAQVRFTYADGSSRTHPTWITERLGPFSGWRYSSHDRAFAPHLELPGLPIAGPDAPIQLGRPVPLAVNGLPTLQPNSIHDIELLFRSSGSLRAPNGEALILPATAPGSSKTTVWLVRLNGTPPLRVAFGATEVAWSPDGRFLVYRGVDTAADQILAVSMPNGSPVWSLPLYRQPSPPFTVTTDAVLYARDGALWRMPFDATAGSVAVWTRDLPGHGSEPSTSAQSHIAIDGSGRRIAYACGPDLCLIDMDGGAATHVAVGDPPSAFTYPSPPPVVRPAYPYSDGPYPPGHPQFRMILKPEVALGPSVPNWNILRSTWSPDGQRLAVTSADPQAGPHLNRAPRLAIVDRSGGILAQINVGPNGPIDAPHWTADGRFILLRAYPENGRRIVAVEVATSRVFDLSQPGWDALFSPSPDGSRLLLTNGRGGFWIAPIERR